MRSKLRLPRCLLISVFIGGAVLLIINIAKPTSEVVKFLSLEADGESNWRNLSSTQNASLSKLGRILFLDEERPPPRNKSFVILIWKYGSTTHDRHMKHYSNKELGYALRIDPFAECPVKNCVVTYEDSAVTKADLVIFHLHRTKDEKDVPKERTPSQIWAFSTDESPYHTFLNGKHNLPSYNGMFNWSMHYRMDADIPVPYGRTVINKHIATDINFAALQANKTANACIAIMGSNCGSNNHRWQYVKELQKWIDIDIYGGCGTLKCPGHFQRDCPDLAHYHFYLAFENSNCDEYLTEKLWWNAYAKGAVPIIMGGTRANHAQLLPPHSYINVETFATPRDLAIFVLHLIKYPSELASYHRWRRDYTVLNEHGYFQSPSVHYCRACEALNYNDHYPKTYKDLATYWSVDTNCRPAWDAIATSDE